MTREDRRAAIAAYKERKTAAGIYAVRCTATGACWVGGSRDLAAVENRLRFSLAQGGDVHRDLQEAWRHHGAAGFAFERVETLADDLKDWQRDAALKERLAHWQAALGALLL